MGPTVSRDLGSAFRFIASYRLDRLRPENLVWYVELESTRASG
jgi:hypothetical protein